MRFFGYYALHSFWNQLRKLFKTWVLIFILACGLMGGLIGFFAANLEHSVDEAKQVETIEEVAGEESTDTAEEKPRFPIEKGALLELVGGGLILGIFLYQAISADKRGGKIFLPADVNLLFPSPMKPQSVLLFRLGTQLGTALALTVYLVFQLPNLMNALDFSWGMAGALLAAWFCTILISKFLQVLLYTVCSTHAGFKKYLRYGVFAFVALIAGCFLLYWKSGSDNPLVAADRFFNAPISRWIPFWGWLKGLVIFLSAGSWLQALLCLVLLAAGTAALVWFIWNINADFYEDAMAKSEETAAMMDKARSEKTSGVAVTKQRKKDRSDSLRRDGLNHGWGASVFFTKTMYNRFRFAYLHFFTKTMLTYFAAAMGTVIIMLRFTSIRSPLPVAFVLGALVFFRAMGDPMSEDVGMDFFRLVPASTWQKLGYSLLGGTVCCLLDLLFPMLAASALLQINPLKVLVWLPLIVSLDFYATSVISCIDLSVPPSIGKTIKQLITIFFLYFGLIPDVGILAVGIISGNTAVAAIISTAVNLILGVIAFSIGSTFLQPKGTDYVPEVAEQDFRQARKLFSAMGIATLVFTTTTNIISILIVKFIPSIRDFPWGIWIVNSVPQYIIGMPLGLLILTRTKGEKPATGKLGAKRGFIALCALCLSMIVGYVLGILVTGLAGVLRSTTVTNPVSALFSGSSILAEILFIGILAPIAEEFFFRKQLIDRMRIYGGKTSVVLSALLFGLMHGNFNQFFYTFGMGLVFGYIYLNTGRLRYTIGGHMLINLVNGVLISELAVRISMNNMTASYTELIATNGAPLIIIGCIFLLLVVGGILGFVLLIMNRRNLRFPAGALELPKSRKFAVSVGNMGIILAILVYIGTMIYALFR